MDSNNVQAKKARYNETKIALIDYLNELKSSNLNSTHSLPPEIEDAINNQFSNLSIEESELLLEEIIYPGILILIDHPNALIGDAILRIFLLNSVKTVLLSSKVDFTKFISIFNIEDWLKLEPRAICMRISIISALIESRVIINGILSDLKQLVALIFKGFQNETYFIQLSATKLISLLINMKILENFILQEFLTFQSNLILSLKIQVSDGLINRLQFYKYLFSDINTRKFLFQNNIELKNELENHSSINGKKPRFQILNEFCNFVHFLVFHNDILISNQGIELFNLALSDESRLYSNNFQVFIKDVINSVKAFISTFSPKETRKHLINKFSTNLKLLNIVIGNNNSNFLVNSDFGILIINFISSILKYYPEFTNNSVFIERGVVVMLLKIASSFKLFTRTNDNTELVHGKTSTNSQNELTELEIEFMINYFVYSFEINKLLLINLSQISSIFQITEPQIINYSTLLLSKNIISCKKFVNSSFFTNFNLKIGELLSIYEQDDLSNWQLFLLIKYLILLYSLDLIKLIPNSSHSKTIKMISEVIFTNFNRNSDSCTKLEIRKYSLIGPNVILTCFDLLNLVFKVPNLSKSLFELSFSISEELLRICLSFKISRVKMVRGELFHDDYVEFLVKIISILRNTDIPANSRLVLCPDILDYISEFSKNGFSPTTLDCIFFLIEIFLRNSPENIEIGIIENLIERLLLFYIPYEQQDGYLQFYNSYKQLCSIHGRPTYLPDPVQINEDFVPNDYSIQHKYMLNDQFCVDSIIGRFAECNLDCIGE
ncbi:uncharacterized protein cubi_02674 [Cryptosporidium ubiquitum]|uniref:Uncharacterized protein n=1 Tax=Cryptosporidium ubiquitum TaxID=857276 RepID=A0A1J4MI36_9CRYT|nr:uncharacterized protein cubi_02674 [Cryptosporidium ubiquitum]OII73872.1 hypothetical protein cubi_02674 [Cryptosporidium ubiquitum]